MNDFIALSVVKLWRIFSYERFERWEFLVYSGYHLVDAVILILNN